MSEGKIRPKKIACGLPGHEADWIEFETAEWTLADMREMFEASYEQALMEWVEKDSIGWHLTGDDGIVVDHPGRAADRMQWLGAYAALGPKEGFVLRQWLGFAPYRAALELTRPDTKSALGSEDVGEVG